MAKATATLITLFLLLAGCNTSAPLAGVGSAGGEEPPVVSATIKAFKWDANPANQQVTNWLIYKQGNNGSLTLVATLPAATRTYRPSQHGRYVIKSKNIRAISKKASKPIKV